MAKKYEDMEGRIRRIVNQLREKLMPKFPGPVRKRIEDGVKELEEVFMKARPPRFAIVGKRGSGKSSLINAFFSEEVAKIEAVKAQTMIGKWYEFKGKSGKMSVLDTRGLGKGSKWNKEVEKIKQSLGKKCPDAFLFSCKAKEVDARVDEDLKNLLDIKSEVKRRHNYNTPVIGIVTQVDE